MLNVGKVAIQYGSSVWGVVAPMRRFCPTRCIAGERSLSNDHLASGVNVVAWSHGAGRSSVDAIRKIDGEKVVPWSLLQILAGA
jgi:hypothetical protein